MDGYGKVVNRADWGHDGPEIHGPPAYLSALANSHRARDFFANTNNCALILDALGEEIGRKGIRLLSLDFFDTALLRETRSEQDRFWATANRIARTGKLCHTPAEPPHGKPASPGNSTASREGKTWTATPGGQGDAVRDIFIARNLAAESAYAMRRAERSTSDPVFTDIAACASSLTGHGRTAKAYMRAELAQERVSMIANPLLLQLRKRFPDVKIVFVSDMYLPSATLRMLLASALPDWRQARIFSSADGMGSKAAGDLFAHVAHKMRIAPGKALHIGDNLESDVIAARRSGWNAFYLPLPNREIAARRASFDGLMEMPGLANTALAGAAVFTP